MAIHAFSKKRQQHNTLKSNRAKLPLNFMNSDLVASMWAHKHIIHTYTLSSALHLSGNGCDCVCVYVLSHKSLANPLSTRWWKSFFPHAYTHTQPSNVTVYSCYYHCPYLVGYQCMRWICKTQVLGNRRAKKFFSFYSQTAIAVQTVKIVHFIQRVFHSKKKIFFCFRFFISV